MRIATTNQNNDVSPPAHILTNQHFGVEPTKNYHTFYPTKPRNHLLGGETLSSRLLRFSDIKYVFVDSATQTMNNGPDVCCFHPNQKRVPDTVDG